MRNQLTLDAIVLQLQRNCGDRLAACKAVGVSLIFVNQWAKDDKEVHEKLLEAERVGNQGLVSAAIQRAVHGVEKDVYYKGEVVGQQVEYSDGLLTTLLKAKVPEFSKEDSAAPSVTVNIANLMPRATSYEQWLEMKTATLANSAQQKLLDARPAEDAEFVDVSDAAKAAAWIMAPQDEEVPAFQGIEL